MHFTYVKNKDDYIKFVDNVKDEFESVEEWEDFFGFNLKWNEETGEVLETIFDYQGEIENCPNSFPAIIYHIFDTGRDRYGDFKIQSIDFATFKELGVEIKM